MNVVLRDIVIYSPQTAAWWKKSEGSNTMMSTSFPVLSVTASSYRSLNTLTEVEEPAGMGESLGTGAHRHRSILPPGVKYVPGPRVLRRILSNRS